MDTCWCPPGPRNGFKAAQSHRLMSSSPITAQERPEDAVHSAHPVQSRPPERTCSLRLTP